MYLKSNKKKNNLLFTLNISFMGINYLKYNIFFFLIFFIFRKL